MVASRKYFGTDGIRGRVGQGPISADFMLRLGNAYGHALAARVRRAGAGKPVVIIGKDTRISNYMFEAALEAGLVAAGVDVQLMGPMPTPAVSHLTSWRSKPRLTSRSAPSPPRRWARPCAPATRSAATWKAARTRSRASST
jgi:phosphoglucomutase